MTYEGIKEDAPESSSRAHQASSLVTTQTLPVSVVMPAYGHADYILASLESVLRQATPPREVIVIDDGSPDDTATRLAPLVRENRIRYVRQPNAGMAAARNEGARMATSEYLYFLDDDDLLFPNALSWMAEELNQYPEAAMVYGDMVLFSGELTPKLAPPRNTRSETQSADRTMFMLFNQLGSPGQVLIRRSAFWSVGGFDTGIWGTDDWDLWLRLLERYPARREHRPVVAHRLHGENASRNIARMYKSSLRVARRHLRNLPDEQRPVLRRYTYKMLRHYHVPRLEKMLRAKVERGEWWLAAAAARAWVTAWTSEASAYVALKARLLRKRRWSLPADEPLLQNTQARQLLSKTGRKTDIVRRNEHLHVPFIGHVSGVNEGAWLLHGLALSMQASVCVEIGSAAGLSACYIGLALKQMGQGRLYAIDPHTITDWNDPEAADSFEMMKSNLHRFKVEDYVEIIRDYSQNAAKNWRLPIDLLYIDGDHSYEGVKHDWEAFAPHVKPFGVVVFHDTTWDLNRGPEWDDDPLGVPRFVEELRIEGYPVITINKHSGLSMVQMTKGGRSLAKKHLRPPDQK